MPVKLSKTNVQQVRKGTSFTVKSSTKTVGAPSVIKSSFKPAPPYNPPKTTIKVGKFTGMGLTEGNKPAGSFKSFPIPPVTKPVIKGPTPIVTKVIQFKTPPPIVKPTFGPVINYPTKPSLQAAIPIKPKPSTGSSDSGGGSSGGKIMSISLDSANAYMRANPGARGKDIPQHSGVL